MKKKIKAKHKYHLEELIMQERNKNGNFCNLNHIDISEVGDLSSLFFRSDFNGDISQWDTSNVFSMENMFHSSKFNGDISKWNVENVKYMEWMFYNCPFEGDISNWKPYKIERMYVIFGGSKSSLPYWINYEDKDERMMAINAYHLENGIVKELRKELNSKDINNRKKLKI
jgi:hypothetical protein